MDVMKKDKLEQNFYRGYGYQNYKPINNGSIQNNYLNKTSYVPPPVTFNYLDHLKLIGAKK